MSTVTTTPPVAGIGRAALARRGLTAAGFGLAAVALVRVVAVALSPGLAALDPFGWTAIVVVTFLAAAVATLVYALVSRRPTATRDFLVISGLVLLVSFAPVFTGAAAMPGMTTGGLAALVALHIAAAVGIVVPLVRPL